LDLPSPSPLLVQLAMQDLDLLVQKCHSMFSPKVLDNIFQKDGSR